MAVLVVAETDGASLPRGTLATVTAALAIETEVDVLVLDEQPDAAADAASRIAGVRTVIKASGAGLAGVAGSRRTLHLPLWRLQRGTPAS